MNNNIKGLYIHVPFCIRKCDYCGFYSITGAQSDFNAYLERLSSEAEAVAAKHAGAVFETCFIGGGNPTSIGCDNFKRLLSIVFKLQPAGFKEFTIETNPETFTPEIAAFIGGISGIRLSMGIQRLKDCELKILGRLSSLKTIYKALDIALSHIKNVSADFIMGVPGCPSGAKDLKELLKRFSLRHVSAYFLSVESNTPLQRRIEANELPNPCDIGPEELYDFKSVLSEAGFEHYEISNYAKTGFRCAHNINYWRSFNYLGLGPSAVSTLGSARLTNAPCLKSWLSGQEPYREELSKADLRNEFVMLNLRLLNDGLSIQELTRRFGAQNSEFYAEVEKMLSMGRLIKEGEVLRLSLSGIAFANDVMSSLFI